MSTEAFQTGTSRGRILVVDDEKNVCRSLQGVLEDEEYEVETVAAGEDCLALLEKRGFDAIFLDIWLPGNDGLEVLKEIAQRRPRQVVIMISGHGTIESAVKATKLGAYDFIEKPLSLEKVMLVLENALRLRRLEEENRSLKDLVRQETTMVGDSVPMRALRQQIEYAAPTEGRVLIYGENGTGKELVARLLHLRSKRSGRAFVEVNCAALPEDLIEAELFGSVKGAYTGASESREGKFAAAHRGTLFLDEVGDMSLKSQAKVLRVLEEQRFHPVGANQASEVDVRVIAATNKDLEALIQEGSFREDLFFRLNVLPFEVPPLRQRSEDVPALFEFFMDRFSRHYGRPPKAISPQALDRLQSYAWPGNVRELKNMVERLAIMIPGEQVELSDLPRGIRRASRAESSEADGQPRNFQQAREEFERRYILEKLEENDDNVSRTAAAIGMERTHLHRKLKALGIRD
ncbi:MAG TPA: sigma-54 dependent transcriptional regulator [Acidobacteriota bacterium]|nr:sigma-54 dependent transcriptional regulator [Acidobacteriota bacterium]